MVSKKKLLVRKKCRSNVYFDIKTTDQLLQRHDLAKKTFQIVGVGMYEIKPKQIYKRSTYEKNDDLIQLLIDLEIVDYDWEEIQKQTHRAVGNRIIEFSFEADKIIKLHNRIAGKKGKVKKEALELIARDINSRFHLDKIVDIFSDIGVPESMFGDDSKWRGVFYVLSYYTTSNKEEDISKFVKILEYFTHPLSFAGNEEKAKRTEEKYNKWLKYDNIQIKNEAIIDYTINTTKNILKHEKQPFYITKENDDFYHEEKYIKMTKSSDYYKVFCSLFSLRPRGGRIDYETLIQEIKSRIPKTKNKNKIKMQKFIQGNLTDKSNGFLRRARIPNTEDNGKPLISIEHDYGVIFNNQKG